MWRVVAGESKHQQVHVVVNAMYTVDMCRPVRRFQQGGVRKNDGGVRSTPKERVARLGGWYGRGVSPLPLGGPGGHPGEVL